MLTGFFALLSNILFFTGYIDGKSFAKPLSKDKELELLRKIKAGDINAKNKLAEHNMRLVVHIVKKYASYGDNDELISVGNLGLSKAINTFDVDRQTVFATYAARCIENEILMSIRANKKYKDNLSLYEPISFDKDGNEVSLIDIIADEEESILDKLEKKEIKEKMELMLDAVLDEREREIIKYRYGLSNNGVLTQQEIADKYNISRSYVSRIETKSLLKLRKYMLTNKIQL
ncbi:MAG: RNA polymerase sporulation sigma factor SigK [Christensenella sp.]|nr:RNA polymerase sporulation sigma factor SigK [Christensenella sp.]